MNTNANAAARVAGTIGVFKWVIIAVQLLAGVASMLGFNSSTSGPAWAVIAAPVIALLWALFTWVLFGWFQHTLGMLAAISANTAPTLPTLPVEYKVAVGDDYTLPRQT